MKKFLSGVALGAILGAAGGWAYWGHGLSYFDEPEPPKAQVRQGDGSLVLERAPEQQPTPAPHVIPKGGKETRRVEVTLQPAAPCPPVDLVLSLAEFDDGSARIVASSPGAAVTKGLDIPVKASGWSIQRRWAGGVSYAGEAKHGVFIERDVWRLRLGLQVNAVDAGTETRLMVGWTW